ncbi:MAG TPA: thiolase family protein [Acidimicrobiia bacterium]|nr:thiolase family protein [Acidimicrobiia bacterium]
MSVATRNPAKDQVAIAAAATTGFTRSRTGVTPDSLAVDACVDAIRAAGIDKSEVNGLIGANNGYLQSALGIPEVNYYVGPGIPFGFAIANAVGAVSSGQCDVALVYHALYRNPMFSRSAANDPFRRGAPFGMGGAGALGGDGFGPDTVRGAVGYTAWASRYLYEYGETRDLFGYIALNDRSWASHNPGAVMRDPMTMDDYLDARMIRWPLSLFDMDVPVDGADAFVVTTAERARDMALPPVLVHACTTGQIDQNEEDEQPSLHRHGQHVVVESLRAKSDFWIDDIDVFFPYDGFSFITVSWIENSGWCGPGEARAFIEENWDDDDRRLLLRGRIPVNPHGGGLSEGATQGSGHTREAVHQLQGLAGDRQVPGAARALLFLGGFFFNSQGVALRAD